MPAGVSSPLLVGRERELEALSAVLSDAANGDPALTIVIGEAGVGKTRLTSELEAVAAGRGMLVMRGECLDLSGGAFPYAPIAAALRDLDPARLGKALAELPGRAAAELARAFPDSVGLLHGDDAGDELFAQSRLFGWLLRLLRALSAQDPVLLVVEDLQWADTSSRDFLLFLVQSVRSEQLAILATARSEDLHRDHPARELVAQLVRNAHVKRVQLAPLDKGSVQRLIASILGTDPAADLLEGIFARGEGNAFFTEELLAARATARSLPPTLRDTVMLRLDGLGDDSRELLRTVALWGRPVDDQLLALSSELDGTALGVALRESIEKSVIALDAEQGLYTIRHALVAEVIADDLLPSERTAIHARIAGALERTHDEHGSAVERARHWHAAREPARELLATIDAGLAAERVFAHQEALEHLERAVALWSDQPPQDGATAHDLVAIRAHAAEAARWTGDSERAVDHCRGALAAIDAASEPDRAARLYERIGRFQAWNVEESLASYRQGESLVADDEASEIGIRLRVGEALALTYLGRWGDAQWIALQAVEAAHKLGARAQEGPALAVLGACLAFQGDPAAGEARLREAMAIATDVGNIQDIVQIRLDLAEVLRLEGRIDDALNVTLEGEQIAMGAGARGSYGYFMAINATEDLFRLGRWSDVTARLPALPSGSLDVTHELLLASVAGRLDVAQGRFDAAAARFSRATELMRDRGLVEYIPDVYAGHAELALWQGQTDRAREIVAEGAAKLGEGENVLHVPTLYAMGARVEAEAAAHARAAPGGGAPAPPRAVLAYIEMIEQLIGDGPFTPPQGLAHLAGSRAEAARASGHDDPELWDAAAGRWRDLAFGYQLAYARFRQGEAIVTGGGSRADAVAALSEAGRLCEGLGAEPLGGAVAALAKRARLTLRSARPSAPQAPAEADAYGLTERELEVLALVGEGLTNREIAARLFISQHTAGVHVSHILTKLGVPNRVLAAAAADKLGLGR